MRSSSGTRLASLAQAGSVSVSACHVGSKVKTQRGNGASSKPLSSPPRGANSAVSAARFFFCLPATGNGNLAVDSRLLVGLLELCGDSEQRVLQRRCWSETVAACCCYRPTWLCGVMFVPPRSLKHTQTHTRLVFSSPGAAGGGFKEG